MAKRGFPVYDFRKDIRNVFVSPEIRCRFMRMEPGETQEVGHSHDLGHEVFLVLQGRAVFEVDGVPEEMGPGQMCIALAGQDNHTCRNVGDEPVIMYLSVTPHIQPTHTSWNDDGTKKPPQYHGSGHYDDPADTTTPTGDLIDGHVRATEEMLALTEAALVASSEGAAALREATASGDAAGAQEARDTLWAALLPMWQQSFDLAQAWNDLTSRLADEAE